MPTQGKGGAPKSGRADSCAFAGQPSQEEMVFKHMGRWAKSNAAGGGSSMWAGWVRSNGRVRVGKSLPRGVGVPAGRSWGDHSKERSCGESCGFPVVNLDSIKLCSYSWITNSTLRMSRSKCGKILVTADAGSWVYWGASYLHYYICGTSSEQNCFKYINTISVIILWFPNGHVIKHLIGSRRSEF